MRKNTANSEKKMDLIRQMPRSKPRRNSIKSIATRPPIVVRLLPQISGTALLRATMTASRVGSFSCSSL